MVNNQAQQAVNPLHVGSFDDSIDIASLKLLPWIDSVSDDGNQWTIKDVVGSLPRLYVIDFDSLMPDASRLSDPQNQYWQRLAKQYSIVMRQLDPGLSSVSHYQRFLTLKHFISYLNFMRVKTFAEISPELVQDFFERSLISKESVTDLPERLFQLIFHSQHEIPRNTSEKSFKRFFDSKLNQVGLERGPVKSYEVCRMIENWARAVSNGDAEAQRLESLDELKSKGGYAHRKEATDSIPKQIIIVISQLWSQRARLSDDLPTSNFLPFTLKKEFLIRGTDSKRHKTIPPKYVVELVSQAFAAIHAANVEGPIPYEILEPLFPNRKPCPNDELRQSRIRKLLKVCVFIVIGITTARRRSEIMLLEDGCVTRDDNGHHWLKVYIAKTMQDFDYIPIPEVTALSLSLLSKINKSTNPNCSPRMFESAHKSGAHSVIDLNQYCVESGISSKVDTAWTLKAHQLRRIFAMLYFWKYEQGDLAGLSHHLRHFDLEMTRRYITDTEFCQVMLEIEAEAKLSFLRNVSEGKRQLGGSAGRKLQRAADKLIELYRKSAVVVPSEAAASHLKRLIDRYGISLKLHVWGTICGCPSKTNLSKQAQCKGALERGPNFSNATISSCATCVFAVQTEDFSTNAKKALSEASNTAQKDESLYHLLANAQARRLEASLTEGRLPMNEVNQ